MLLKCAYRLQRTCWLSLLTFLWEAVKCYTLCLRRQCLRSLYRSTDFSKVCLHRTKPTKETNHLIEGERGMVVAKVWRRGTWGVSDAKFQSRDVEVLQSQHTAQASSKQFSIPHSKIRQQSRSFKCPYHQKKNKMMIIIIIRGERKLLK